MTAEMRPMTTTVRGLLLGLMVALAILGALLSGTGIAYAYTGSEVHYLFQLNELQVPGSDQSKLNLGNEVCAALRAGDRPRADISVLQQRTGLSLYAATNVVHSGHCVAVPRPEREVRPRLPDRKPARAQRGNRPRAACGWPVDPIVPGESFPDEMRQKAGLLEGDES
jgi:hypothetical protein